MVLRLRRRWAKKGLLRGPSTFTLDFRPRQTGRKSLAWVSESGENGLGRLVHRRWVHTSCRARWAVPRMIASPLLSRSEQCLHLADLTIFEQDNLACEITQPVMSPSLGCGYRRRQTCAFEWRVVLETLIEGELNLSSSRFA